MKVVIQRVAKASVSIENKVVSKIAKGLLVLVGIGKEDTEKDIHFIIGKILKLRIFQDSEEKMNKSVEDIQGEVLLISQFTLYADCKKGNRPSFTESMQSDLANKYFQKFCNLFKANFPKTQTGVFAAHMSISLINDGPVTIIFDSQTFDKKLL